LPIIYDEFGYQSQIPAGKRSLYTHLGVSEEDYRRTVNLLEHFYNIVLTDCGTGLMHSAMYGVLGVAGADREFESYKLNDETGLLERTRQRPNVQRMELLGTAGRLAVEIPFNAPNDKPTHITVADGMSIYGGKVHSEEIPTCDQYTIQGDAFSHAILENTEVPVPLEDALGNMKAIDALFRYEGTTCSNMGRPLLFDYHVQLGPRGDGYPIRAQRCRPAAEDTGHTHMCGYISVGDDLIAAVGRDTPLAGEPLRAVIGWTRPLSAAGCYCDDASRVHKWGLVLETIHYALAERTTGEA
jgi:hypothetical protein